MTALFNPWVLLGWLGSLVVVAFLGYGQGRDSEIADQSRVTQAVAAAGAEAASAAASKIADIKVTHTTVRQTLEKEVHEKPVFVDCRSGPDAVRLFNSTIPAPTLGTPDRGLLPPADAASR